MRRVMAGKDRTLSLMPRAYQALWRRQFTRVCVMVGSRFAVVFALYPRVTQLDFTGPFEVFARLPGAECVLASTEGGTIQADGGLTFARVARLSELAECALLCVPGGFGCIAA